MGVLYESHVADCEKVMPLYLLFVYFLIVLGHKIKEEVLNMKARQQGNALVLTIPTKFQVEPNTEFVAIKGENGSITYVPKLKNVFEEAAKAGEDLRTPLEEEYMHDIEE
ncbi:type II toxin-antitoxin system PemI/MazE family antitoxin [Enterococcus rivorum]|nr:hypothetical protein [Enterococcus rivorum]